MHVPQLLVLAALTLAPLSAQVVRGGDLVVLDAGNPPQVLRIDAAGAVIPIHSGAPLTSPSGLTVAADGDLVVADYSSNSLLRIDAQTGVITTIAGGLGGPLRVATLLDGDFVVTSNSARALLRVTPGGAVSTIAAGPPFNRPFGVDVDFDGDLLVADDLGRAIWRVTPTGGVTLIATGGSLRLPQGIGLFPSGDYAVIDGIGDQVLRIDRATNAVTSWAPASTLGVNPEGIVTDWSGGFFISHSGSPGGPGVRFVDALGGVTAVPVTSPSWSNPEDVVLVPQVLGPGTLATGPSAQFTYAIDSPRNAGEFYTLILSASVHPGWPLLGTGPESLFLNLDGFFVATIGQNAPPFLANWTGFLSPTGSATATVDLRILPPGALAGLVLYQQGITLNGSSISGAMNVVRLDMQ